MRSPRFPSERTSGFMLDRSAPEQKLSPAPWSTTTRVSGRAVAASTASPRRCTRSRSRAFLRAGRFSRSQTTGPSVVTSRDGSVLCIAWSPLPVWGPRGSGASQHGIHERPCFFLDPLEVLPSQEALRVDLVDVLRPRGARREPTVRRHDLQPSDGGAVAGGGRQLGQDGLSGELRGRDALGGQACELGLLRPARGCVESLVDRRAVARGELVVEHAGVLARARGDLRGEQVEEEAVLVRGPHGAVPSQEGGAGALLAAEAQGPVR